MLESRLNMNTTGFWMISRSALSHEHLEYYPVWSEFYDYEEREEILEWGINAASFDQDFARHHDGSDHAVYTLLQVNPFPPRMRIYIKAKFVTPAGQSLSGYIVNVDADPAAAVFFGGREFIFNTNLRDLGWQEAKLLREMLVDPSDPLFPLIYRTDFMDEDGKEIQGAFDLTQPKNTHGVNSD